MDDLLDQFVIEGRELVQSVTDDLLALERSPGDAARLASAFRAVHTLKGSAGLFDLAPMSAVMHAAEDLIGALSHGRLAAARGPIDALLAGVGAADEWIEAIAQTGGLPPGAAGRAGSLAMALRATLGVEAPAPAAAAIGGDAGAEWMPALLARHADAVAAAEAAGSSLTALRYVPAEDCFFLGDDPLALVRTLPGLAALHVAGRGAWDLAAFDPFACRMVIEALSTAPIEAVAANFRLVPGQVAIAAVPAAERDKPAEAAEAASRSLRVDTARMDDMANLVGELIVAKNALAHLAAQAAQQAPGLGKALNASHMEIERLTGALHRAVMGARMVPMSQTLRRFPRLVRELAGMLHREVQFDMTGGAIEADKTIVDGLYEPLLHMLRNAVDHGIEPASIREAAGKPAMGRISLDVVRQADQIVVSVTDDGGGIDLARLRRTAKLRQVAADGAIDAMDDAALLDLVFAPGFSTAEAVTAISGRGVGMDAVRNAVQALGGAATIASRPGAGSTIRLTVPQGVAITTLVIVRAGGQRFGVPMDVVAETMRLPQADMRPVPGGAAFVLRGCTIPLLRLADLLGLPDPAPAGPHGKILVVACGDHRVGVAVDGFDGRREVLLRPLGGLLAAMPGLLGGALLGDGQVLMVLDMAALIG